MNGGAVGNGDASSFIKAHPIRDLETQDLGDNVTGRECSTCKSTNAIPYFEFINARPDL
jgi:hypothetical protein